MLLQRTSPSTAPSPLRCSLLSVFTASHVYLLRLSPLPFSNRFQVSTADGRLSFHLPPSIEWAKGPVKDVVRERVRAATESIMAVAAAGAAAAGTTAALVAAALEAGPASITAAASARAADGATEASSQQHSTNTAHAANKAYVRDASTDHRLCVLVVDIVPGLVLASAVASVLGRCTALATVVDTALATAMGTTMAIHKGVAAQSCNYVTSSEVQQYVTASQHVPDLGTSPCCVGS